MKKKWIRYTAGAIGACIVAWIILLAICFFYVQSQKEKLIASIEKDISQKITAKLSFDDLTIDFFQNFPGISIHLKNVRLQDSMSGFRKKELLSVQHFYVGFGPFDLLAGKKQPDYITLSNGNIYLFTDSLGNKNWNILKKQPGNKNNIDIKKITFKNVDVVFEDIGKFKYFNIQFIKMKCSIHNSNDRIDLELNNNAIIKNSSFSTKQGSYLANKKLVCNWSLVYNKTQKKISLQNQVVRLNNHYYRLSANFTIDSNPYFDLSIETNNLLLTEAASLFPPKTEKRIDQFKLSRFLRKIEAYLNGPMKYLSYPLVKINFSVNDADLNISATNFEHCSFNGFFQDEIDSSKPRDDYNSFIRFTEVKGEWEKNPFTAKNIAFYNLVRPYIKSQVDLSFSLAQIDKAISSPRIDFNNGEGEANINYEGPLEKTDTIVKLNGKVTIHNGDITYNPRNLNFKKTELELAFQNGDALVNKMNTEINGDAIHIKGKIGGFLNFFNTNSSKASFEWSVYSPYLDIGKLKSSLHRTSFLKKKQGYSFLKGLNNKIDSLFDNCNAYLNVKTDKLVYKNFSAEKVNGKLTLKNDMIGVDDFSLLHAGGSITINASLKDNGKNSDLALQTKMDNVNIKELFKAFNNFGLQSLTYKNINGNFSADINLISMLDADNDLYKPANKGYVIFSLQNGDLENFTPLMDIDNNFLQKRDLSHVNFAELKDRFDIDGNDIKINRIEISSTAVTMYVEGTYSFVNNTDLSIQIPLLRQKKEADEVPQNKGTRSKGGISVFLRAKDDKDGKLKINYDLLGRFRSKK